MILSRLSLDCIQPTKKNMFTAILDVIFGICLFYLILAIKDECKKILLMRKRKNFRLPSFMPWGLEELRQLSTAVEVNIILQPLKRRTCLFINLRIFCKSFFVNSTFSKYFRVIETIISSLIWQNDRFFILHIYWYYKYKLDLIIPLGNTKPSARTHWMLRNKLINSYETYRFYQSERNFT